MRAAFLLGILAAGILGFGLFQYYQQEPRAGVFLSSPPERLHYAGDEAIALREVRIKAFYFVPRDRKGELDSSWQEILARALAELKHFYEFQLHQATAIRYDIYPEPILGEATHSFYDGADTSRGNPQALISIRKELLKRVFDESGDLYLAPFVSPRVVATPASVGSAGEYEVIAILYEGVGSSATLFGGSSETSSPNVVMLEFGELPAFLVSKFFLTGRGYQDYGLSIFAHEFGHTLGLSDSYDPSTGEPLSDDLMGAGRFRPLPATYLSREAKAKLGLPY